MPVPDPAPNWTCDDVVGWLHAHSSPEDVAGMARYGIETGKALGIRNSQLRPLARKIKRDHQRALDLWKTGIREARLIACFSDEPRKVTEEQAWQWAEDFDSWEVVDHAASLLLRRSCTTH